MYTKARIQTATGTIQIAPINPTPSFFHAQKQATAICDRLGKGKVYRPRIIELVGGK